MSVDHRISSRRTFGKQRPGKRPSDQSWRSSLKKKALKVLGAQLRNVDYEDDRELQRNRGNYKLERKCLSLLNQDDVSCELKIRRYEVYEEYGDMLLETKSVVEKDKPGRALHSDADIVFYVWKSKDERSLVDGYLLFLQKLQGWFRRNKERFEEVEAKSKWKDKKWTTLNRAVPIDEFPDGTIYQIPNPILDLSEGEKRKLEKLSPVVGTISSEDVEKDDIFTIKGPGKWNDDYNRGYLVIPVEYQGLKHNLWLGKRNRRRIAASYGRSTENWDEKEIKVKEIREYEDIGKSGMILVPVE